jgi:hypothetical protein
MLAQAKQHLINALNEHVELLNSGRDFTEALVRDFPEAAPLFYLARRMKHALVPVVPSAEFVRTLRYHLLNDPTASSLSSMTTGGWQRFWTIRAQ